jgi:hypothetical protein
MIDHLQQEIAEFVLEVVEIAARDRICNLIGFLDGVGSNRRKILLEVPGAARHRRAQRRHHLDQAKNVAGRFHVVAGFSDFVPLCRIARGDPSETGALACGSGNAMAGHAKQ